MWLPLNGQPNKLRINKEHYMKYTVTSLNGPNEPMGINESLDGNKHMDMFFFGTLWLKYHLLQIQVNNMKLHRVPKTWYQITL
jgi:hypothetical protein